MKKVKEITYFAQSHWTCNWHSQDLDPSLPFSFLLAMTLKALSALISGFWHISALFKASPALLSDPLSTFGTLCLWGDPYHFNSRAMENSTSCPHRALLWWMYPGLPLLTGPLQMCTVRGQGTVYIRKHNSAKDATRTFRNISLMWSVPG